MARIIADENARTRKVCTLCTHYEHMQCQCLYAHEVFELKAGVNPDHVNLDFCLTNCGQYIDLTT